MNVRWLKELLKGLPDDSPVVMWFQHEDRAQVMAQVSITSVLNANEGCPAYLLLMAYERDIIRGGKIRSTQPQLSSRPAIEGGKR